MKTLITQQPVDDRVLSDDRLAELAWDYCERMRKRETPSMEAYLQRLPAGQSRDNFRMIVAMSSLIELALVSDI